MQFNVIGAGRLGKNLALAIAGRQLANLIAICNKSLTSAVNAVSAIGSGTAVAQLNALPPTDLTFITPPDDLISPIVRQLAEGKTIRPGSIVVHCSGVLSSEELQPLKGQGCLIASLHPLKAFAKGYLDNQAFKNCDCIVEGDEEAIAVLSSIFDPLGAMIIPIKAEKKAGYHAAAVFSSNYLVTLASVSVELLLNAGIDGRVAQQMAVRLMKSSLANVEQASTVSKALTGPLARGDIDTIKKHLDAIDSPAINTLYRAAAVATLSLTGLDNERKTVLHSLLLEKES
ncbi:MULTISPECIES: Rossmann-like and DUF2520 domain-containing protein [unclassified Legionella]|uniref:Rossmann-like and DUF2520 domain-containing protein n=1 Tax=unclassified Legionella TaxID=2622702 RepID=UPI00105560E1|nr:MULTISPECIES: Rossmann-like and DUF2520 domain-containing protein [unclassified Legionella]MDI9818043.1 DUF2520 domain-containing protein [Legionella sp. PL877]